jgi:rhamnosyltransferase
MDLIVKNNIQAEQIFEMTNHKVVAVVVTYQPVIDDLTKLLNALVEQVDSVIIVDNGSVTDISSFFKQYSSLKVSVLCLGNNMGVAFAQNTGIKEAEKMNATHVLLFDQDSIPAPDMVLRLMSKLKEIENQGIKVAAVGPCYKDERNIDHPSFISVSGLRVVKSSCRSADKIVESDVLISSGTLIPMSILKKVGGPLTELFIDQVDSEWCFRAKSYGYRLFGVCDAVMHHSLGEDPITFLGRRILHHSPLRHYYIFRNAVWLLSKRYVPLGWKLLFIRTILIRLIVYCGFVEPRLDYLKMMVKGIWHGLVGRLGKYGTNRK